jgi:hypothetical protein
MRTSCLLLLGLLSTASNARAAGFFLSWDACHADGGVAARTFACDTNSGSETLVCSVVLDAALSGVNTTYVKIVGQSASGVLPPWWGFQGPACRTSSLTLTLSPAGSGCPNLFPVAPSGGFNYTMNVPTAGAIKLEVIAAVPDPSAASMAAGQEYGLFAVHINHARTVGAGSCPGCGEPMCLGLGYLELWTTASLTDPAVVFRGAEAALDQGHLVSWQNSVPGGVYWYQTNPPFGHEVDYAMTCSQATPSLRSTWGAVKTLYR